MPMHIKGGEAMATSQAHTTLRLDEDGHVEEELMQLINGGLTAKHTHVPRVSNRQSSSETRRSKDAAL